MPIHAVLTGDIVNSTKLDVLTEKKLVKALNGILQPYKFEFYRGDSFQVYMKEPGKALQVALLCRAAAIKAVPGEDFPCSDIRISIGIGNVKTLVKTLGSAKGEAFTLSGRLFDEMQKTDIRLSMAIEKDIANTALLVIADYVNAIFNKMTVKQAEVVFLLLKGETQQAIADTLKKSKSTISQFAAASRWAEIERLLQHYQNIINQSI